MAHRCLDPAEVVAAQRALDDDPRRLHLLSCPRCRALLHAWHEFVDPSAPADAVAFESADQELSSRLERELAMPARRPAPGGRGRTRRAFPWWGSRPLYGLAAALLFCAGVIAARDLALVRAGRLPEGTGALRGDAPTGELTWTQDASASQLTWRFPPGATGAVVILYDGALRELERAPVGAADSWQLDRRAMSAAPAFAQVLFLADGDTLLRSRIVAPR